MIFSKIKRTIKIMRQTTISNYTQMFQTMNENKILEEDIEKWNNTSRAYTQNKGINYNRLIWVAI